jgi:predicted alpha/beta-hydrolase family hydrolase
MSRNNVDKSVLEVSGFNQRKVPNIFFQQPKSLGKLAVIHPGLRYNCEKPLLYFTTEALLQKGFDVIQLWADYTTPEFQDLNQTEQTRCLVDDSSALLSAGKQTRSYDLLLLGGKSMGTLTMTLLLNQDKKMLSATTLWLTPLLYMPPVVQVIKELQGPAFIAGSDADPTFDMEVVSEITETPNISTLVVNGGDHSLEIPGDVHRSLQELSRITNSLSSFLR